MTSQHGSYRMAAALMACALLGAAPARPAKPLPALVNPFIGTGGHGHTFPGPSAPAGMVQLSPDTRAHPSDWDGCGGYHASDRRILGFSHTHLSGTGVADLCDILVAPYTGALQAQAGQEGQPGYGSAFDHASERAWAGYYAVTLKDHGIRSELTASPRVGFHRHTFPAGREARIAVDLVHRDEVLDARFQVVSNREIQGWRRSRSWARNQGVYFVARFSRPIRDWQVDAGGVLQPRLTKAEGRHLKAHLAFGTAGGPLEIQVGLSAVDLAGARRNLEAEGRRGFDEARRAAEAEWERELSRIRVSGGSRDQRVVFYTALYHALLAPNRYQDVDGRYRGMDGRIHHAAPDTHFTVFSLWDTFRTLHPLMTLLDRTRTEGYAQTMLRQFEQGGRLPVWELQGNETDCMIGYHAVPVLADAILRGFTGFDYARALEAMKASAEGDRFGLAAYRRHGYIPAEEEGEGVSKTLEYAFDDACIARVAGKLGRKDDQLRYDRRAQGWKHLFDPSTGFFRGRLEGHWWSPFDPSEVNANFTEGNAWQYAFFVPHDVSGLMAFHGGAEAFAAKLDALFAADSRITGTQQPDITGLVGQYAHGNEPSHHLAYLHAFVGQPWKTQARVRQLMDGMYRNAPDGLIGNEDCGQMSAWLVMSALGFYSVTPASGQYVIGTPWFPEATVRLQNGALLTVRAPGASSERPYIQALHRHGKAHPRAFLTWEELMAGGELRFTLGAQPTRWGSAEMDRPHTATPGPQVVPAPFVAEGASHFRGATAVRLGVALPGAVVRYTLDGSEPTETSPRAEGPIPIDRSRVVKARAWVEGCEPSPVLAATFTRVPEGRVLSIQGRYSRQYSAGDDSALIDGLRGGAHWRQGRWQGYQGQDGVFTVDLGKAQPLGKVALGCIQDTRSWILMPREVVFEGSADGQTYRELGRVRPMADPASQVVAREDLGVDAAGAAIRYLRVTARHAGPLPPGHPGAGNPSFFFVDEILAEVSGPAGP